MKKIVLGLLMITAISATAQEKYKVLTKAGAVELVRNDKQTTLVAGTELSGKFAITLKEAAYLGLMNNEGKVVEIHEPGNFSEEQIATLFNEKEQASATSKYASYLLSSQNDSQTQFKVTGAVERNLLAQENAIKIGLPEKSLIYGSNVLITWNDKGISQSYKVKVLNLYRESLAEFVVTDRSMELDLSDKDLRKNGTIIIQVFSESNDDESNTVALQLMNERERKIHDAMLKNLDSGEALEEYVKARYFLENDLYADAFTSYARAAKLAPQVDTYVKAYRYWLN